MTRLNKLSRIKMARGSHGQKETGSDLLTVVLGNQVVLLSETRSAPTISEGLVGGLWEAQGSGTRGRGEEEGRREAQVCGRLALCTVSLSLIFHDGSRTST